MTRKEKGAIGEVKVLSEFIKQGYSVFLPYGAGNPVDLIAYKDGVLERVSVKYTSFNPNNSSWEVTLKNVSRRNHGTCVVKHFDNTSCDLLAVYIAPEDRVVFIKAHTVTTKSSISIKKLEG